MDQLVPAPQSASRSKARPAARRLLIMAEGLLVLLVLASIAGTLGLIVLVYRQGAPTLDDAPEVEARPAPVLAWSEPLEEPEPVSIPDIPPEPEPEPEPEPVPEPEVPVVDPTLEILAAIDSERAELKRRATEAAQKAEALETALQVADRETARQQRQGALVKQQIQALESRAELLSTEAQLLGLERDILARQYEEARSTQERERLRPGYAIVPYRGPHGTWRRPIPVECVNGGASLPPSGPTFTLLELTALNGRTSPLVSTVVRLATLLEREGAPDGQPVDPYVLFIVRPDGIRPYYEARARLEAAGVEYGYELVDQDAEIEFPELDDPTIWGLIARPPGGSGLAEGSNGLPGGQGLAGLDRGFSSGFGREDEGRFPPSPPGPGGVFVDPGDLRGAIGSGNAFLSGNGNGNGNTADAERPWGALADGEAAQGQPFPRTPERHLPDARTGSPSGSGTGSGMDSGIGMVDDKDFLDRLLAGGSGSVAGGSSMNPGGGMPADPGSFPVSEEAEGSGSGQGGGSGGSQGIGQELAAETGSGTGTDSGAQAQPSGVPGREGANGGAGESDSFGLGTGSSKSLELIIACTRKGIVIHPGGYRLTNKAMEEDEERLTEILRAVVLARRLDEPGGRISPKVRFLVEPESEEVYWTARRQIFEAGLDWPTSLQVSEPRPFSIFGTERW